MTTIADNPFAPTQTTNPQPIEDPAQNPFTGNETVSAPDITLSQPQPTYPDGSMTVQNQSFGTEVNGPINSNIPMEGFAMPQQIPSQGFATPQQTQGQGFTTPQQPVQGFTTPQQVQGQGFTTPQQPTPGFTTTQQPVQSQGFVAQPVQSQGFVAQPVQSQGFTMPQQSFTSPQQMAGQNFNMPQQNNFHTNDNQQPKYAIIDMYWLVNRKIYKNESFIDGEVSFLSLGYNANFNNLRMGFYVLNQQDLQGSSIIIQNMRKVTIANLHSEGAGELLFNKGTSQPVRLYERVIRSGNWTPNITQIYWYPDKIIIQTQDSQGVLSSFTLLDWQVAAFESVLNFMIDGNAWSASLNKI